jgi:hypothetical protein
MPNLISIELGNEPEGMILRDGQLILAVYNSASPIIAKGQNWSPTVDAASQQRWHQSLRARLGSQWHKRQLTYPFRNGALQS